MTDVTGLVLGLSLGFLTLLARECWWEQRAVCHLCGRRAWRLSRHLMAAHPEPGID